MKLNRKNPLTQGMIYAKSFAKMYEPDSVTSAMPKVVDYSQAITTDDRYGPLVYMGCSGVTGDYFDAGISPTWSSGDELTVCIIVRGSSGDDGTFIGQRDDTNIAWQIYNFASQDAGATWCLNVGNQTVLKLGSSATANDDEWHIIHVRLKFGTEVQLFVDGVADVDGAKAETRTPYSGATPMAVGVRWATYPTTAFERACDVAFAGLWRRRLTDGEIASHAQNPWQLFAPQRITLELPSVGEIVITEEGPTTTVIITDVNTNETWQDGATGLIVTGTGFV